jgi:hypothetical protein
MVVAAAVLAVPGAAPAARAFPAARLHESRPAVPATAAGCSPWRPAGYRVSGFHPILVTTCSSAGSPAYVAWIDHVRTRLALYPGLQEPPSASQRGPGEVPVGERWRLLATFNGGFKAAAGAGGLLVNGRVDEPLQTGRGTLVEYRNGAVSILDWLGRTRPSELVLARQNLTPLVWAGRPAGTVGDGWLWGETLGNVAATWRSAVGVTAAGDLVYAAAAGQTAASLAELMVGVGAVRAIELDINPEWPSFISYARRGGRDPLALVPNPQQSPSRYLVPDSRDFFAVYTRAGGGARVPFR